MPPVDSTLPPCTDFVVMTSDPAAAAAAVAGHHHNHHHQRHANGTGGGAGGAGSGGGAAAGVGGAGGGPTNSTPTMGGLVGQDEDLSALLYIVITLLFYSMGIVVGIITYLKRERADMEEEKVFDMYLAIKRDPFNIHRQEKVQQMARRLRKLEQAKADRLERERQERERMALVASWDDAHDLTGSDGEDLYSRYASCSSPCLGDSKKNKHVKITDCVPIRTPSTRSSRRGSGHGCVSGTGSDTNSDAGTAALYPLVLSTASMLFGSTRPSRSPVFQHPQARWLSSSPAGGGGSAASFGLVGGSDHLAPPRRFSGDRLPPFCSMPTSASGSSPEPNAGDGEHPPDDTPAVCEHHGNISTHKSTNSSDAREQFCEPPRRPSSSCVHEHFDHESSAKSGTGCEHHGRHRSGERQASPRRSVISVREQLGHDDSDKSSGSCEHHGRKSIVGGGQLHGRQSIVGDCEHHGQGSVVGGCERHGRGSVVGSCEHHGRRSIVEDCGRPGRRSIVGGCEHHGRGSIDGGLEHHGRSRAGGHLVTPRKSIIGGEREHLLGGSSSSPRSGEHERRGALPVGAMALNVPESGPTLGTAGKASSPSSSSYWAARNADMALLMPGPVVSQPGRVVRNSPLPSDLD